MKGYKGFNIDLSCRPGSRGYMKYEIGRTYSIMEDPVMCERGFHFCRRIVDVFGWYCPNMDTRVCEVEAIGKVMTSKDLAKYVTDRIRIVRELSTAELKAAAVEAGQWRDVKDAVRRSIYHFVQSPHEYVLWAQDYHLYKCTDKDVVALQKREDEWMQVLKEDEEPKRKNDYDRKRSL